MRVIAVDDERLALEHLGRTLREVLPESEVQCFREPETALDYARKHEADAAFLDIELYGMSGIELARCFKEVQPKLNIVFVTGYPG